MTQNNELIPLFPAPLMVFPYLRDYSKELEWIKDCKCGAVKETKGRRNRASLNRQSEDTFILDDPELKKIHTFIETKLNQFVSQIYGSDDRLVITQSWLNRNGKGESHHEHTHPNSMISGVWYPQIHEQLPPIEFRNRSQRDVVLSIQRYNTFNSQTFLLPIKRGELILFPSNLTHGVPPNQSDEERISLSFNTWPKGSLGDISSLTFLPFDRLT